MAALPAAASAQVPQVIAQVKPSIVAVATYRATRVPPFRFVGTGFAVGDGTLAATNAHVVPATLEAGADPEVLVALVPGEDARTGSRRLTLVASDPQHDLAVLRMEGTPLKPLKLRDSATVQEGDAVLFTGFPLGAGLGLFPATHRAMVAAIAPVAMPSASGKELDATVVRRIRSSAFPIFQLDVTAFPGNSGSPLYDPATGEVLGIINLVYVRATKEAALERPSGISYAIPSKHLIELLERLKR
jgi:S1-C subfamily serine protease